MHRIIFWDGDREIGSTPWDMGLEKAKAHAKFYRRVRKATLAQVFDTDTQTVVAAYTESGDA